jgi:hypothetical protein
VGGGSRRLNVAGVKGVGRVGEIAGAGVEEWRVDDVGGAEVEGESGFEFV